MNGSIPVPKVNEGCFSLLYSNSWSKRRGYDPTRWSVNYLSDVPSNSAGTTDSNFVLVHGWKRHCWDTIPKESRWCLHAPRCDIQKDIRPSCKPISGFRVYSETRISISCDVFRVMILKLKNQCACCVFVFCVFFSRLGCKDLLSTCEKRFLIPLGCLRSVIND